MIGKKLGNDNISCTPAPPAGNALSGEDENENTVHAGAAVVKYIF